MADDNSEPMAKALAKGRAMFPPEPQPARPIERPCWFRYKHPTGEEWPGRAFDPGTRYTINEVRDGFRFTYWHVMCHGSTAGPYVDSNEVDKETGQKPVVTWVVAR